MQRAFNAAVAVLGAGVSVFYPRIVSAADEPSEHAMKVESKQTAPHEKTRKRSRASTPDHIRSSTHDEKELRLEQPATPGAGSQKLSSKEHATQELSPQHTKGSTFADRTAESLVLVGNATLHEAAERCSVDALRVFMRRNHRTYTDESPIFAEKLRIFKWNADYVRERNAQLKEEEGEGAERVGLNLRSDRIRACDVKFGQRMDLDLYTRHSELEGTRPKNVGASMPDHLRSSTHDRLELQSGLNDVPATCGAPSQTPALQQPVTQDLAPQEAGGSTFADRTAASLKLVGNTPLHEAAERFPADALRVFMSQHHRTYTDESPDFPERLRIFKWNAEHIREMNALKRKKKGEGAQLLGLNLHSDEIQSCDVKFGGERMDHYFHPPGQTEQEAMLLKGIHARVPDHIRSTHDGMEPRSGEGEAPVTCAAGSQKPASKQHGPQDVSPQYAGGSTFAERTAKSLKLVGSTPLHEAAARCPADALRVFMSKHHRTYTDESPEFPERLRIFTSNAEGIRTENARIKERNGEGAQLLGLNLRSDMVLTSEMKFGGERMDHYSHQPLPSEREAMLLKEIHARVPDHLRSSTHVKMEPRSGEGEAPATRAAGSRKPASKQRATQELLLQDAGGSTFSDRMAESLKLVGDTPLHEAAERYPIDAYRVFMRKHHMSDTDEGPEFPERLKIFTRNAQIVREDNALTREEEGDDAKLLELTYRADNVLIERPKRACTGMPDRLRSSSHGGPELRSGEGEAPGMRGGGSTKPASERRAAQGLAPQDVDGSAFAERTAVTLELIGDTPLHDAAERYPVDALRVFIRQFHRTYTDESVEFPERLRMFKLNAEYIREANAQIKDEEGDGAELLGLNLLADEAVIGEMKFGGQLVEPYPGDDAPGHSD